MALRYALHQFSFENQEIMQFDTDDNFYGIPATVPTQTFGDKLVRFCDLNSKMNVSDYILHFYCDDYKFMQVWRNPERYIDRFKQFKAIISPNFSLYTDFPIALQILSCYRKQWCAAFFQEMGVDVIPNVTWGEKESFNFCFDGIPKHSVVSVSSVGVRRDNDWDGRERSLFVDGWREMMKRLEPTKIILYGTGFDELEGDIICVKTAYQQRMDNLLERRKNQNGDQKTGNNK